MGCPPAVRAALTSVEGVEDCQVDFASESATIEVKKGTDTKEIVKALEGTRFAASVK